jgi:hypothetical protein
MNKSNEIDEMLSGKGIETKARQATQTRWHDRPQDTKYRISWKRHLELTEALRHENKCIEGDCQEYLDLAEDLAMELLCWVERDQIDCPAFDRVAELGLLDLHEVNEDSFVEDIAERNDEPFLEEWL